MMIKTFILLECEYFPDKKKMIKYRFKGYILF